IEPDKVDNIDDPICEAHIVTANDFLVEDNKFEDEPLEKYNDEELELDDDSDTSSEEESEISGCPAIGAPPQQLVLPLVLALAMIDVEFCEKTKKPILDYGKMLLKILAKTVRDTILASTPTWKDVKKEDIDLI
ncbi:hypothetical protein TorRG33x02_294880, partial [Trema orientale]